jgi:hypothetical protein
MLEFLSCGSSLSCMSLWLRFSFVFAKFRDVFATSTTKLSLQNLDQEFDFVKKKSMIIWVSQKKKDKNLLRKMIVVQFLT